MEGYLGVGVDLVTAIDKANESLGLHRQQEPPPPGEEPVPTAADNDRALAELSKLLGGVA